MKQHFFSKQIVLFLSACFAGYLLLVGFLSLYTMEYFQQEEQEGLEQAAFSVSQSVTAMLDISHQDFQYLLENETELLMDTLSAVSGHYQTEVFITDSKGKVIVSAAEEYREKQFSSKLIGEATEKARNNSVYETDLEGFCQQKKLCKTVLLEKDHGTHKQRVGCIFLLSPASPMAGYVQGLLKNFFVVAMFVAVMLILCLWYINKELARPLHQLNQAAQRFAKGDFSGRLSEKEGGELVPLVRTFNEMADRVEENEKVRQTFVSNVSHDLRTPLTTIGGFIQNMAAGNIPPEKSGHYYKIILDEVNRLSRLVQTLLETSRMTAGERKYNMAPMDLCELARIILLSFEAPLEEKNIQVSFSCTQESIWVLADKDAIQQAIYNLVDNAIKFTPIEGSLSLSVTLQGKKALFAICNSGEGIPEEEMRHLFDRFYKSDRSRGLDKKGMGLGLFITKSIVAAHGEEIWVESRQGEYTRFLFSLPLTDKNFRN